MIDPKQIRNMSKLLDALEMQAGVRTLLRYMDALQVIDVTAPQFFDGARRNAAVLEGLDLSGTHIGIMGANRPQWMSWFCAIFWAGAVAVLLSPDLDASELSARAKQADLSGILFDASLEDVVEQATLPEGAAALCMDRPPAVQDRTPRPIPCPDDGDLACILFTSGTTATPKAVMLSHRAMVAGVCHNVIRFPFKAQLAILPLHHVAGFATVLNSWYLDALVCIGQDMKYLYRYLEHMKPDYTLTVPSLLQPILRKLRDGGPNGHLLGWDLHMIGCGGAKFQPEVIQALNDRNIRVLQSYGATEAGGLGFDWEMTPACKDTIGKPCEEIQTKLVDGELYLRSDSLMMGYYKDPEATKEVLKDGWYATGDLCEQDEEGYLYLRGRKKDLIILSNGENVSPEWIESRLSVCPDIREVMVAAQGQMIGATVFPKDDSASVRARIEAALEAYNRSVPTYQQVHVLHFTDRPFPKTVNGKIMRRATTGEDSL